MTQGQPFTGYNQMGPPPPGGPTFGRGGGPPGGHPWNQFVPGAGAPNPGQDSLMGLLTALRSMLGGRDGRDGGGGGRGFGGGGPVGRRPGVGPTE
jgi:hypothetical protein